MLHYRNSKKCSETPKRLLFFAAETPDQPKWVDREGYSTEHAEKVSKKFARGLTKAKLEAVKQRVDLKGDVLKKIPERETLTMADSYTVGKEFAGKGFLDVLKAKLPAAKLEGKNLRLAYAYMFDQAPDEINDMRKGDVISVEDGVMAVVRDGELQFAVDIYPWPERAEEDGSKDPTITEFLDKCVAEDSITVEQKEVVIGLMEKIKPWFEEDKNDYISRNDFAKRVQGDEAGRQFETEDGGNVFSLQKNLQELFGLTVVGDFLKSNRNPETRKLQRLYALASLRNFDYWVSELGNDRTNKPALRDYSRELLISGEMALRDLKGAENKVKRDDLFDKMVYAVVVLKRIDSADLVESSVRDEGLREKLREEFERQYGEK